MTPRLPSSLAAVAAVEEVRKSEALPVERTPGPALVALVAPILRRHPHVLNVWLFYGAVQTAFRARN